MDTFGTLLEIITGAVLLAYLGALTVAQFLKRHWRALLLVAGGVAYFAAMTLFFSGEMAPPRQHTAFRAVH